MFIWFEIKNFAAFDFFRPQQIHVNMLRDADIIIFNFCKAKHVSKIVKQ